MTLTTRRLSSFAVTAILALSGCGDDSVSPAALSDAAAKDGTTASEAGDGTREVDASPDAAEASSEGGPAVEASSDAPPGDAEPGSDATPDASPDVSTD